MDGIHSRATFQDMAFHVEFSSALEMIDAVQLLADHAACTAGLDEEARHRVRVAMRECLVNAVTHGNCHDCDKRVFVDIDTVGRTAPELSICVRDQGAGFDPDALADPLAPENLLKPSGRGVFLIRTLMDDVQWHRASGGGMEIRMTKRVEPRRDAVEA
jgi:serine/threonine-protein kinase RsbW